MKSIKDIKRMTLEELEAVSLDEGIKVPEGLSEKVRSTIESRERKRKVFSIASAAAAVVVIVAGLSLSESYREPEDTFDDPYLAYAEVEKALAMVTEGMRKGINMVEESESVIERTTEILK